MSNNDATATAYGSFYSESLSAAPRLEEWFPKFKGRRFLDTSKQGFAAVTVHLANMGIATLLAAEAPGVELDGCSTGALDLKSLAAQNATFAASGMPRPASLQGTPACASGS